ncbi:MAG: MXAN_6640 family putative metalloprotease [Bacteroidota bacterium]
MYNSVFRSLLVVALFGLLGGTTMQAQQIRAYQTNKEAMRWEQRLERAFQQQQLSVDQRIQFALYAGFDPQRLPDQWKQGKSGQKTNPRSYQLRCMTSTLDLYHDFEHRLAKATQEDTRNYTLATLDESYISPSGKFEIKYTTSNPDDSVPTEDADNSGVPDYVERAAQYADSSYYHQVDRIGFSDPILDSQPYEIRLQSTGGYYGYTSITSAPSGQSTTYIVVHNNFENFPSNDDPQGDQIGALKVTIAHEFKHAIQYVENRWAGESDEWAEMDATLMEDITFDNVNDYYNYNRSSTSIFSNPTTSFYPGSYEHAAWALYFVETADMQYWVNVWRDIKHNNTPLLPAMQQELEQSGRTFEEAYTENHLWHYASGPNRSPSNRGFEEREQYPHANATDEAQKVPSQPFIKESINKLAAGYYDVRPQSDASGSVYVWFAYEEPLHLGILSYATGGSTSQRILSPNSSGLQLLKLDNSNWNEIERLGLVVTNPTYINPNSSHYISYQLGTGNDETIEQFVAGDIDGNGELESADIDLLQEQLVTNSASSFTPAELLFLDVSGNSTISSYDAALLLRRLHNSNSDLPTDGNGNGRVPDVDRFTTSGEDGYPYSRPELEGSAYFAPVTENANNAIQSRVEFQNQTGSAIYSVDLKMSFPADSLDFTGFSVDEAFQQTRLFKTEVRQDTVIVSLASSEPIPNGTLGTFEFRQTQSGEINLELSQATINEQPATASEITQPDKLPSTIPENVNLLANYPNPFNPTTNITYQLPENMRVKLEVFDTLGRRIATLVNETKSAGEHTEPFEASALATGVYIYRLSTPSTIRTQKMLYLK